MNRYFKQPVIVVCGFKSNHEFLVKHGDVCSDRPSDNYLMSVDLKHRGKYFRMLLNITYTFYYCKIDEQTIIYVFFPYPFKHFRYHFSILIYLTNLSYIVQSGIFASNGKLWKEHRAFTLSALRSFGVGGRSIEYQIAEEVSNVLDILAKKEGTSFRIYDIVPVGIVNVTCNIMFGQRFEYIDKSMLSLLDMIYKASRLGSLGSGLGSYFPWMRFLPGIR